MAMRLLLFSDLHHDLAAARRLGATALAGGISALVCAGDLGLDLEQLPAIYGPFRACGLPAFSVPGNHDGDPDYELAVRAAGWTDIDRRMVHVDGWTLAGYGHLHHEGTFYGPDPSEQLEDPDLATLLEAAQTVAPERLVLVTHLPPFGTLASRDGRFIDFGSAQLRRFIEEHQPAAVLCGHVHHREPVTDHIGRTLVVNAGPHGYVVELAAEVPTKAQ